MNSPRIISTIWYGANLPIEAIYPLLIHNVWQSLVVVSLGALVGCAITFVSIDKLGRRTIQMIGFFWLFILFIVIGASFNHLVDIGGSPAIIVLYILSQIFFNFGMSSICVSLSHYSFFQTNTLPQAQTQRHISYLLSYFRPAIVDCVMVSQLLLASLALSLLSCFLHTSITVMGSTIAI
jgi:hypothetical protein